MIYVAQNASFEAIFEAGETDLIPGLQIAIIDNDGNTVYGPTTNFLTENEILGEGTGVYTAELTAPGDLGQFTIVWSRDGTFEASSTSVEDLIVLTEEEAAGDLPAIPDDGDGGLLWGPIQSWVTPAEIDDVCNLPESSNPIELIPELMQAAAAASQFLWAASGRQFIGVGQRTVRPCRTGCSCDFQVLSRGHVVHSTWAGDTWVCDEATPCGCGSTSMVKLAGYPVREIVDVTIDGVSVDAADYDLREYRFLVRMNGGRWPVCQDMSVTADEEGSFAVTYTYGQNPPQLGKDAAAQLACELAKLHFGAEDCALPSGARRVTRQGITIDATYFTRDENGKWVTGLPFVDAFLVAVNPSGLIRRPTIWAPGREYPRGD